MVSGSPVSDDLKTKNLHFYWSKVLWFLVFLSEFFRSNNQTLNVSFDVFRKTVTRGINF